MEAGRMTMTPVESSNVAAIGFDAGTLRVRFRDGSEYEYADCSSADHTAFLTAQSKGRWLNTWLVKRSGAVRISGIAGGASGPTGDGPVHVTDAEGCCAKHLANASLGGKLDSLKTFECPRCGTAYDAKAFGPLIKWNARCDVLIFATNHGR